MDFLFIIGGVLLILFLALVGFFLILLIIKKSRIKKMYSDVENELNNFAIFNKTTLEPKMKPEYDYIIHSATKKIYIKVIPNISDQEITVNSSVKWQLRRTIDDKSIKYVENIDAMMRRDLPAYEDGLQTKKLYIIYPNAKSLLKYINECEMEFVDPTTDVYGTRIITYNALKENNNIIDL